MTGDNTYGLAFHKLREARGYTLKKTAEGIVTPQFLGEFEKGKSKMSIEHLGKLLFRLSASWADFYRYCSIESVEELQYHLDNIYYLFLQRKTLQVLREIDKIPTYPINPELTEIIKATCRCITFQDSLVEFRLKAKDKQTLFSYIQNLETFLDIDYSILIFIQAILPYEMIQHIDRKIQDKWKPLIENEKLTICKAEERDKAFELLLLSLTYYSRNSHWQDYDQLYLFLEEFVNSSSFTNHYYEKLCLKWSKACMLLRRNDPQGLQLAKDCILYLQHTAEFLKDPIAERNVTDSIYLVNKLNKTGIPFDLD